jgi:hypothetical protein
MNINDLTIGQAIEISKLFPAQSLASDTIYSDFVGKYVICRSRNEGVNCGVVEKLDSTGVVLSAARRLYYHKPANKNVTWYEGVARTGLSSDSKIGTPVNKIIVENYSLTICTESAKNSLVEAKDNEQC